MDTERLIEGLHQLHVNQETHLKQVIDKIDKEMTMMIKVIAQCAQGPHMLKTGDYSVLVASSSLGSYCLPSCSVCLAKRYLSNSLTEDDLKLVKGEK